MWTGASVAAAKNVDFPTLGFPTTPNSMGGETGSADKKVGRCTRSNSVHSPPTTSESQNDNQSGRDGKDHILKFGGKDRFTRSPWRGSRRLQKRIHGRGDVADPRPICRGEDHPGLG